MTLKQTIEFVQKNLKKTLLIGVLGSFLGVGVYYPAPQKNIAGGSLFVTRSVDDYETLPTDPASPATEFFTYEGYYAGQSAALYSATVIALLESDDIKSQVLRDLSLPVNERNLRYLGHAISVKKLSPQLIYIEARETTKLNGASIAPAPHIWSLYIQNIVQAAKTLNSRGDPQLVVVPVSSVPVVKKEYKNIYLNVVAGFVFGVSFATLAFSTKEYLDL